MSTELVKIPFHGTDLLAVDENGKPQIILRPAIESLGLDFSTQRRKLTGRSWACMGETTTQLPGDVQRRTHTTVDVRTLLMLLATINENNVAEEKRPLLVAYQSEVADVIEAYWNNGVVVNNRIVAPRPTGLDAIQAMVDEMRRIESDVAEAREIATKTDARLDAIEGKHDWFSAIAYARLHALPTSTQFLRKLGGCAGRIGRSHGIEPTQVQHQLYGWVNSWPAWVWDLAVEGFEA
ncbi:phage antirepressor N-terminal domain-containing protein [Mycobacteroides abscessus]|uniref:phage antirepressor N-terminal domain-containing protein n=1 Tax=Mycobacteroides abscessus TaxID=36809 RepID=UPI0009C6C1D4|nr:phage antirepressor N-terminal domain-containing protein [Mycobacteroides abscessus]MBN7377784.1 phage antirepressor [Mycobacteroides abscessus subsp. massiliense]SKE24923.1 prophage antirepressor [Mycobacteroides abscessus subsp. massiliense]